MPEEGFDARPSIRLDNKITENPKVVGLSDASFRAYIEALCYCSRNETDGKILAAATRKIGPPRVIKELLTAGLLEQSEQGYQIHDYLRHQRSSAEIESFRESRSKDGKLGAHLRWHVPRRVNSKDCPYCLKEAASA